MAAFTQHKAKDGTATWRASIRITGYPNTSKSFRLKSQAKDWAMETESAMKAGEYQTAEPHTLGDVIDRYLKTVMPHKRSHSQDQQLNWWKERLGNIRLDRLQASMFKELAEGLAEDRSPATVNRYLAAISHALTVSRDEWEWCEDNPVLRVKKMKESKGRDRVLLPEEQDRLLVAARSHRFLLTAITLALSTGARRAEIWDLMWNQVDFEQLHIVLRHTKNDRPRIILLRGIALERLVELHSTRRLDTDFVFHNEAGTKSLDMRSAWRTALKNAKIDGFRWHDLRHTAITRMAEQGATLLELQLYSGHSSGEMVRKYAHLTESHISDKVEAMVRKAFG